MSHDIQKIGNGGVDRTRNLLADISRGQDRTNPNPVSEAKRTDKVWNRSSNPRNPETRHSIQTQDPYRTRFEALTNLDLELIRIRRLKDEELKLSRYGHLMKQYGHRAIVEAEDWGHPTQRLGSEVDALRKILVAYGEDFPGREFPI